MTLTDNILKTWYPADHHLHLDPLPAALGLVGEAGELIDLYKKDRFKDGFSWWECVHCGFGEGNFHNNKDNNTCIRVAYNTNMGYDKKYYTPKILDELGDFWYYFRILAYQQKVDISIWALEINKSMPNDMLLVLSLLNLRCVKLLIDYNNFEPGALHYVLDWFLDVLYLLDITLDQLTESNWAKLKDGDTNGWAKTLES